MNGRFTLGLIVVLLGVVYLLGAMGIINANQVMDYFWPCLLILIGITRSIENKSLRLFDAALIIIGSLFLLDNLGYPIEDRVWNIVWPVLLIMIGIRFMFTKKKVIDFVDQKTYEGNSIDSFALFGGSESRITSKEFKGGNVSCLFGGVKLDFLDADVKEDEPAKIDLVTMFGGTEMWVPKDWNVVIEGFPIFGGWENKAGATGSNKKLIINATVAFGGLEIKTR